MITDQALVRLVVQGIRMQQTTRKDDPTWGNAKAVEVSDSKNGREVSVVIDKALSAIFVPNLAGTKGSWLQL